MRTLLLAGVMAIGWAGTSGAVTITPTVTFSPGTTYNTAALTDFSTLGPQDMIGSVVTASFNNNTTRTAIWGIAGAIGLGWTLTEVGDTFSSNWTLSNLSGLVMTGFTFNGVPGNTAFDVVSSPSDSPGSSTGKPFSSVNGPAGLSVNALYTNRLLVGGTFYGDEYTQLAVTFGGTGLRNLSNLIFVADTDNASVIRGGITPVPEPASLVLLGMGVAAVAAARRRQAV